jgi:hypothetical protein
MNRGLGRLGRLIRGNFNLRLISDLPAHDADSVVEILRQLKAFNVLFGISFELMKNTCASVLKIDTRTALQPQRCGNARLSASTLKRRLRQLHLYALSY